MIVCGQTEVGELAGHALVSHQNVLRLQVPVVDSNGVAVLDGVQDLEEGPLGKSIITNELALLGDVGEQITFWAVFDDNVSAVWGIHDLYQRDYIRVGRGLVVELDLPLLELSLPRLQAELVESLDSIGSVCVDVHGGVHYSVGTEAKDSGQLQPSSEDLA